MDNFFAMEKTRLEIQPVLLVIATELESLVSGSEHGEIVVKFSPDQKKKFNITASRKLRM